MNKSLILALAISAAFLPAAAFATAPQPGEPTACYDLYQPVCAAQQVECFAAPCYPVYKTYSNSCFAAADNAAIIHDGECTASETGPIKPATTTTATTTPVHTGTTTPVTATSTATTTASTTAAITHSFLFLFWHAFLSWFH